MNHMFCGTILCISKIYAKNLSLVTLKWKDNTILPQIYEKTLLSSNLLVWFMYLSKDELCISSKQLMNI